MRLYQSENISFIFNRSIIWGYINQETFPSSLTIQSYEVISIRKHFLHLWPFNHMRLHQSGNVSFIFDRSIIWGYINQETFPSSLTFQSYEVISIRKHFLHLWPFNHMRLYQSGNISFIFDRSIIWGYINQETFPSSLTVQSYARHLNILTNSFQCLVLKLHSNSLIYQYLEHFSFDLWRVIFLVSTNWLLILKNISQYDVKHIMTLLIQCDVKHIMTLLIQCDVKHIMTLLIQCDVKHIMTLLIEQKLPIWMSWHTLSIVS
jgi:predicted DNA-binding transcriptional regulator AlpA